MAIVAKGEFPVPAEWGMDMKIWVGGCIRRKRQVGKLARNAYAHAHSYTADDSVGWTCVADTDNVITDDGKPTRTIWHEWAHHKNPNQGHTLAWCRTQGVEHGFPEDARRWQVFRSWEARQKQAAIKSTAATNGRRTRATVERAPARPGTFWEGFYRRQGYTLEAASDGTFRLYEGRSSAYTTHTSMSAAGSAITGYAVNGHRFWKLVG